jgi:hypothetical protein
MSDFQIRSDNVDVEQIMRQIRARIREKRGVDYTEEEIKELARVKLEKFLDPTGVRSDLLAQFRRANTDGATARNFKFEDTTLFESSRGWLRAIRNMLRPILKLFFNPNPLIDALHIQSELNDTTSRRSDLQYELIHNLVLETTRLGIQVKNLKMQVESMSSRLDFDERRARALEGVVQYRPGAVPPLQPPSGAREGRDEAAAERRSRRRRRRGRRPGGGFGGRESAGSVAGSGEPAPFPRGASERAEIASHESARETPAPTREEVSVDRQARVDSEPVASRPENADGGSPKRAEAPDGAKAGEGG